VNFAVKKLLGKRMLVDRRMMQRGVVDVDVVVERIAVVARIPVRKDVVMKKVFVVWDVLVRR